MADELIENATEMVRIYPSDYKIITEAARKRRTIAAQIIHEAIQNSVDKIEDQMS